MQVANPPLGQGKALSSFSHVHLFVCFFVFFCQWVFSHNLEDEISSEEGEI